MSFKHHTRVYRVGKNTTQRSVWNTEWRGDSSEMLNFPMALRCQHSALPQLSSAKGRWSFLPLPLSNPHWAQLVPTALPIVLLAVSAVQCTGSGVSQTAWTLCLCILVQLLTNPQCVWDEEHLQHKDPTSQGTLKQLIICYLICLHLSHHNAKATLDLLNCQIREFCRQAPPNIRSAIKKQLIHELSDCSPARSSRQEKTPRSGSQLCCHLWHTLNFQGTRLAVKAESQGLQLSWKGWRARMRKPICIPGLLGLLWFFMVRLLGKLDTGTLCTSCQDRLCAWPAPQHEQNSTAQMRINKEPSKNGFSQCPCPSIPECTTMECSCLFLLGGMNRNILLVGRCKKKPPLSSL